MAYLTFLHHVCRSHMDWLVTLDTESFLAALRTLSTALDSLDVEASSQAAFAIDAFATYFVRNAKRDTPAMTAFRGHLAVGNFFENLMRVVFNVVVFGEIGNQWSLSRPLLSLLYAAEIVRPGVSGTCAGVGGWVSRDDERCPPPPPPPPPLPQCFVEFKDELVAGQPADCRDRLAVEFGGLFRDVTRSLDPVNRDRFQNRLTLFRVSVKEYAKAP